MVVVYTGKCFGRVAYLTVWYDGMMAGLRVGYAFMVAGPSVILCEKAGHMFRIFDTYMFF